MTWLWWGLGIAGLSLALGASVEAVCEARDGARVPPPGVMVDVGGRRLHLLCKGNAAGPTVVIEQGAGSPSVLWWPVQDKVAAFARVCTYDRAGYLWSDQAVRVRSLEDRAADLHTLLTAGEVPGPYILVGHSFGGPLVRLYAHLYPAQVAGMVLVDTPEEAVILRPSYDSYVRNIGYFAGALEVAARLGILRFASLFLTGVPHGMDAGAFTALKTLVVRPGFFRAMADDPASLSRSPATLRSLGTPAALGDRPLVVITHGLPFPGPAAVLEDGWRDGQHRLAQLSTRNELVVAEHSNHMVQSDQPDLVIDAIRRVVVRVRS